VPSDRLALYTTVYPGVEAYLRDWYRSVLAQTDKGFDLWIGVDALSPETVLEKMDARPGDANLLMAGGSPAQIRQTAIENLVGLYPALVFVDSDDLLYPTRIQSARELLKSHDVAACSLRIIDESGSDLGINFGLDNEEPLGELLPRYNVFGLSNTAYRSDVLRRCLPIGRDCQIVDWLLATRAWAASADLHFDRRPQMAYRQYAANVARVLLPFTSRHIVQATERVMSHYGCALSSEWTMDNVHCEALKQAYERAALFRSAISESGDLLDEYVAQLNRLQPRYVWWWCVAHPELEHLWKN
jgi:hypothetical protein